MLATIREKTQGLFAIIIAVLLIIPFALWGVNSYFESDSPQDVAEVDGIGIGVGAYRNALERQRQSMRQLLGAIDPGTLETPAFRRQVLDGLIDQVLVTEYAREQGYRVSDAQLARLIREMPWFLTDDEQFDPVRYEQVLRSQGMSAAGFEQRLREEAMAAQARAGLSDAMVTPADVDRLVRLRAQRRAFAFAVIPPEKFDAVSVPEASVTEYYERHADSFRTPEQVRVEFVRLSMDDLAKKVAVTEDDLRAAYAEESARFVQPEERRASHILIALEAGAGPEQAEAAAAKAKALRKQIVAGGDFAALARANSEDPASAAKGGDLGYAKPGTYVPEFEQALLTLKQGEVSEPVRTQYGYHLIRVTDVKPERSKPFAEVRAELEAELRRHKAEERYYDLSQSFQNMVYEQPDSLKPAAEALGLPLLQTEWFSRQGGIGFASDPKVIEAAFDPELREMERNSEAIELKTGVLVSLRVIGHRPAALMPLEQVRPQIVQRVRQERGREEAARLGAELLQPLKQGGKSLAAAAREHDLEVREPKPVSRREAGGVDPRILEAVFRAPRPQDGGPVHGGVDLGKDGYALFALKAVEEVDPAKADPALREEMRQALERRHGEEYFEGYLAGLRQSAPIEIYEDRL